MAIRPEQRPDDRPERTTDRPNRRPADDARQINPFDLPFDDDYAETFYQNREDDMPGRTTIPTSDDSRKKTDGAAR